MIQIIKKTFIVFLSLLMLMYDAHSVGHEGSRNSNFSENDPAFCDTGDLGNFDILGSSNKDLEWVITNPTCYGFIIGQGAAILAAGYAVSVACEQNRLAFPFDGSVPRNKNIPAAAILNVSTGMKVIAAAGDCGEKIALASAASAANANPATAGSYATQSAAATSSATSCCATYSTYAGAVAAGVATLGILFETAEDAFNNARVCGHDWYSWQEEDVNGNASSGGGYWRRGSYEHSYSKKLDDVFLRGQTVSGINSARSLTNKNYREFLYGGKEFTDKNGGCFPPADWSDNKQIERLGYYEAPVSRSYGGGSSDSVSIYDRNYQRYYMRGPGVTSNYACYRYLGGGSAGPTDEERTAYDCCVARSQSTMCIENKTLTSGGHKYKFVKVGDQAMIALVGFKVDNSKSQINTICAETKTLCPYDHLLGGGTEYRDYQENRTGDVISPKVKNYCQFNKHCVKIPARPYVRINDYTSDFISSACMNFVGHSQNIYGNSNELLPVSNIKNFSAPLVECMAQTIKNMIQNRAGYTKCSDPDESPQRSGSQYLCESGYEFREGDRLPYAGPFEKFQDMLRTVIKVVLVLSVTFLGYNILLALKPVDRKTISLFIIKFALVVYFALGNGWQTLFVDSIFNISSELSGIVMKLDTEVRYVQDASGNLTVHPDDERKLDGCQFPKFNADLVRDSLTYPDAANDPFYSTIDIRQKKYSPGYEYLKPWDTLDCKFVRALGFGPEMSVPNLVLTILAGLFTGGLGIIFVMFTFTFAFFYISMIIRALHVFLVSTIAIAILILISPITITAVLFQKTKNIFDGWLKQLLGFIVQPVILFAYIAIFVGVMDHAVYGIRHDRADNGGITFSGNGLEQPKGTVCNGAAHNNSIYCIFGFSRFGSYSGLEPIGILIPFVFHLNKQKLNTIIEAGLLMYIFSKFMDKISDVAADITGSSKINSNTPSAASIAGKVGGVARGAQKRGTRVAKKGLGAAARKTGQAAAWAARKKKAQNSDKDDA